MPPSSAQAYQTLQSFNSKKVDPTTAVSQAEDKYGVRGLGSQLDSLRTLTNNLRTSIENVDPSVTGRTSGSLVTEAQRGKIVNNERAPLLTDYNKVSQDTSEAGSRYSDAQGLASNYANAMLTNQDNEYTRLFSAYTNAQTAEQQAKDNDFRQQQLEESKRQAAASAAATAGLSGGYSAGSGTSSAAAPASADPLTLARGAAQTAKANYIKLGNQYGGVPAFARERVLESLQRQFPSIDPKVLSNIIYKEVFPDNWAGGNPSQSSVMASVGYTGKI